MVFNVYGLAWAMAGGAPGGASGGAPPAGGLALLLPWVMIFGIFYLLVFRPQRQKQKELERRVRDLKKEDSVVTSGGIIGDVVGLKEKSVMLRVAGNTKIEVLRSAISNVTGKAE